MTTRLHKIGSIFARANALLRKGVTKKEESPIWHDVYALHPPFEEPRYDRRRDLTSAVRSLFYEEDLIRAKFHKKVDRLSTINLLDKANETDTQKFMQLYSSYRAQGALDDEQIVEVAIKELTAATDPATDQAPIDDDDINIDGDVVDLDDRAVPGPGRHNVMQTLNARNAAKKNAVPRMKQLFYNKKD